MRIYQLQVVPRQEWDYVADVVRKAFFKGYRVSIVPTTKDTTIIDVWCESDTDFDSLVDYLAENVKEFNSH